MRLYFQFVTQSTWGGGRVPELARKRVPPGRDREPIPPAPPGQTRLRHGRRRTFLFSLQTDILCEAYEELNEKFHLFSLFLLMILSNFLPSTNVQNQIQHFTTFHRSLLTFYSLCYFCSLNAFSLVLSFYVVVIY